MKSGNDAPLAGARFLATGRGAYPRRPVDRALQAIPRPRKGVALSSLAPAGSAGGSISARGENARKFQNCKVEMTRCTINSKSLCIFALRGTCFPSKFSVSAVFLVIKGSHTDLHRFDPRRPYSIKTRIKTVSHPEDGLEGPPSQTIFH